MKEIDKTKQNIRIDDINLEQRNDLFKKFTEAGGQVIDERSTKKNLTIDREKQKEHQKMFDQHYKEKISSQRKKNADAQDRNPSGAASYQPASSVFDRFKIVIKLKFLGVTGFSSVFFKKTFFKKFVNYYKPSLIKIQMIYLSLFKKNPITGKRIIRGLDNISPRYYELIEMTSELFDQYLVDQIIEDFNNFPDVQQPLSKLREPLIGLYRALYILKPYENAIYNAFERAIIINSSLDDTKNDFNFKNKDIRNSLFFIFAKLYPRLHTLFCYYEGILFSETDKEIEKILSISKLEKPGTRVKKEPIPADQTENKSKKDEEKKESEKTKEDSSRVDNSIKEGLKLMYDLDMKMLRFQYDKKGEYELLSNNDKALHTFLLFNEFESEYSFILTTNQIRYNVDYSTNLKIDYRTKMQDMYNKLNKCQESFKNYYEINKEYDKFYNERPLNNTQYITYTKKLDEINEKRIVAGIRYKATIKIFMDDLASELRILINDINSEQKFIANPQDVFEFNRSIEGEKKLNKKKIYDAIITLYNFASAFSYRLSSEGDLSGKSEFDESAPKVDNPPKADKPLDIKDENQQKNTDEKIDEKTDENALDAETRKSILDELSRIV